MEARIVPFVLLRILAVRVPSSTIDTSAEFVTVKIASAHSTHPKETIINKSMSVSISDCDSRKDK